MFALNGTNPALDRDLVFDALRNRQTYATNGQRIILQLEANGHAMGQEIPAAESVALSGRVIGTGAIDRIELVRNGNIEEIIDYLQSGASSDGWLEVRLYSVPILRNATCSPARGAQEHPAEACRCAEGCSAASAIEQRRCRPRVAGCRSEQAFG